MEVIRRLKQDGIRPPARQGLGALSRPAGSVPIGCRIFTSPYGKAVGEPAAFFPRACRARAWPPGERRQRAVSASMPVTTWLLALTFPGCVAELPRVLKDSISARADQPDALDVHGMEECGQA